MDPASLAPAVAGEWAAAQPELPLANVDEFLGLQLTSNLKIRPKDSKLIYPCVYGRGCRCNVGVAAQHEPRGCNARCGRDCLRPCCKDLARLSWVLRPLVSRWPDRCPPPNVVIDALQMWMTSLGLQEPNFAWALQQAILLHRMVVKLRRLKRRAPNSKYPELTALKNLLKPSRLQAISKKRLLPGAAAFEGCSAAWVRHCRACCRSMRLSSCRGQHGLQLSCRVRE